MVSEREKRWTPSQQRAIDHSGTDLLLSAAAGSGKTATLTARLIRLLCSPEGDTLPSQVLAVTFTNAAAAEMRSRLYDAAVKEVARCPSNKKARYLLAAIDTVQICTMHSFCLSVIRPAFAALSLPSDFRVADETEREILCRSAMKESVEYFFNNQWDGDFLALCDVFSTARDEESLEKNLLELVRTMTAKGATAQSLLTYAEKLRKGAEEDFFLSEVSAPVREQLCDFADHFVRTFDYYSEYLKENENLLKNYYPECIHLRDFCAALKSAVERQSFSGAYGLVHSFVMEGLGSVRAANQTDESLRFKADRDSFKKAFFNLKSAFFLSSTEEISRSMHRTADLEETLSKVIAHFEKRFEEKKRDRGVLDFNDIEHLAHRLLVGEDKRPTEEARRVAARYKYVFIDEYQDTNLLQDEIFSAVAQNAERFVVGDIKQSIYSFRGAQPKVFSNMRRLFSEDNTAGTYIFMSENFRSSKNVLDYANAVSDGMFPASDVPYDESDRLRFARGDSAAALPSELVLIPTSSDSEETDEWEDDTLISEPDYVAQRIRTMLRTERKNDGSPYSPGDFAILLRSANTKSAPFAEALAKLGIKSNISAKTDVFADRAIMSFLCILNAVANPENDVYLAGAMKTRVFDFSLEETVRIRFAYPDMPLISSVKAFAEGEGELAEKCAAFVEKLRRLREYSTLLSADAFMRSLIRSLDLEKSLAEEGESLSQVRKSLHSLRNIAKSAEKSSFVSLGEFLRFAERMMEDGEFVTASPEPGSDAVNIMSIHQSKGLEFPVCFIACASSRFNLRDSTGDVLFDSDFGIACRLPDEKKLVRCDTVLRRLTACSMDLAAVEEEMRVLYVAMTRARERTVITAKAKDPDSLVRSVRCRAVPDSRYQVRSVRDYLGWVLPALAKGDKDFAVIRTPSDTVSSAAAQPISQSPVADKNTADKTDWYALLKERFDFAYPHSHLSKVPAKLTVSKLYPQVLDSENVLDTSPDFAPEPPMPAFMKKESDPTPAEIGTATHVFMQFCDFDLLLKNGAESELLRLVEKGFITRRDADAVELSQIETFIRSDLFARIRKAKRVFREFRFNSSRPAADFTADEELAAALRRDGTDVIVQGVVDILIEEEDGRLVLADYKTDRFSPERMKNIPQCERILRERHTSQLSYYRLICGEMMGRAVDECLVYSLFLGKSVSMD